MLTREAVAKWAEAARLRNALFAAANSLVAVDDLFTVHTFATETFDSAIAIAQHRIDTAVAAGYNLSGARLPVIVTVTTGTSGNTSVSGAKVIIEILNHPQDFEGLYVTDAETSPTGSGVQIKPTELEWKSMREVEFMDWYAKAGTSYLTKARMADGPNRDVFVWKHGENRDQYYPLERPEIKIVGRTLRDGEEAWV